jgi:hypothetical protein
MWHPKGTTFEGFLMDIHASKYIGSKDGMCDDFDDWYEKINDSDWEKYAKDYACLVKCGEI